MSKKIKKNNGVLYVVISLFTVFSIIFTGMPILMAYSVGQTINTTVNTQGGDYIYNEAKDETLLEDLTLGAFPGPDIYADVNVHGTFTYGGGTFSTTTRDTTVTLTAGNLDTETIIEVMNMTDTSDLTFTMPATSTMMLLLPEIGSTRTWLLHNATTTGDTTIDIILVAGAGMELVGVANTADVIAAEVWMEITCTQKTYISSIDQNIVCLLEEMIKVD